MRRRSSTNRRTTRSRTSRTLRLYGAERVLFIIGAVVYFIGLLGSLSLLAMPLNTGILLLALGGGILLINTLVMIF